jgi:DNA-binding transcriptional LysR family regulator
MVGGKTPGPLLECHMERPIDTRLLLYAITVAEEGNITRAAKTKLFVAPGSLARDIRNLEKRIGYSLFERRWSGVSLTRAGEVFVQEARKSLDHSRRAADRGASASRGEIGVLDIGLTPFLDAVRLVDLREKFAQVMPNVVLNFRSVYCGVQIGLVLREVLDAGLVILPPESDEVWAQCVWRSELVVAAPRASPLAAPGPISLSELSGQAAVWLAREVYPSLYNRLRDSCLKGGCVQSVVREVLTYDEMLDAISSGVGFGFVKKAIARRVQMEGVVFRELKDVQMSVEVGVIHRPDKSSRALRVLLQVLADLSDCDDKLSPKLGSG